MSILDDWDMRTGRNKNRPTGGAGRILDDLDMRTGRNGLCRIFEILHNRAGSLARMAFTQQDLAAIDAAIASGELTIRGADGRMVTLRTMDELLKARDAIRTEMASTSVASARRPYPRHQLASFSD